MEWKEKNNTIDQFSNNSNNVPFYKRGTFYIVLSFILLGISVLGPIIYTKIFNFDTKISVTGKNGDLSSSSPSGELQLPKNKPDDPYGVDGLLINLSAEKLQFGHFYKKENVDFEPNFYDYELPVNIKTDVKNYHEISRKINLDKYLDSLNNYGFAVIENEFDTDGIDFYSAYTKLNNNKLPMVITNDLLAYYYHNITKKTFRDIEEGVFYDSIWKLNKDLYYQALERYRNRLRVSKDENDPVLEAERMEVSFFAIALKLLQPEENQINTKASLDDDKKFSKTEAAKYSFSLEISLKEGDSLDREISLIKNSENIKRLEKSPVLLYYRDYSSFVVPEEYTYNAKLNNFYLTVRWLNSVFPLYHLSENCEDCLLDEFDWRINMAAAALIAKDFEKNQDAKNEWAKIYKFISFFRGLRRDLTYLHYHDIFKKNFGEEYNIEEIFSIENKNYINNLGVIRGELSNIGFLNLEGGIKRNTEMKPDVGMRVLQEYYWPNDYIFNILTGYNLVSNDSNLLLNDIDSKILPTLCLVKHYGSYRCKGFGLDIISLLYDDEINYDYYKLNTNYNQYSDKINALKEQLDSYDVFAWNNNIYWVNMDISKSYLAYDSNKKPNFSKTDQWLKERDFNIILGSWVNLHLPEVDIMGRQDKFSDSGFGASEGCKYTTIDINIDFVEELIAKNKMLILSMEGFGIVNETSLAQLTNLNTDLVRMRDIAINERAKNSLEEGDCGFLEALTKRSIKKRSNSSGININKNSKIVSQSLNGIKLMLLVHKNLDDRKIISIGPIFNYQENIITRKW